VPLRLACTGENAVRFKTSGNLVHAFAFEVFPVNPLDDFCLLWIDDQVAVSVLGVSEEAVVVDLHLSLLVAVASHPQDVVIMSHGFMANERMCHKYAKLLAEMGFLTVTFDFCGGVMKPVSSPPFPLERIEEMTRLMGGDGELKW